MCEENAELSKQLRELQEKLAEVKAKLARQSQELAEVQERAARGQQEAERERHRAESLEAELRAVRLEAKVDKLREIEAIRTQFDGERERLNTARECDATHFNEWRIGMETEKRRLEEQLRDCESTADTKTELVVMESEGGEHYEPEGIIDPSLPIEPVESRDESSEDTSGGGPPPGVSVSGPHGEASELMHSMSRLLEAQTQMMAMQASAVAAQNLPPMPRFTG